MLNPGFIWLMAEKGIRQEIHATIPPFLSLEFSHLGSFFYLNPAGRPGGNR